MRAVDVSCEGEVDEAGRVTLVLKVTNLTMTEAQEIADKLQGPFRDLLNEVLAPIASRDLAERTQ